MTTKRGSDGGWEGGWIDGLASHGLAQIRYLAERGDRDIAIPLPRSGVDGHLAQLRFEHACRGACALGLPQPKALWLEANLSEAVATVEQFRRAHPNITAFAAFSDDIALVALSALAELGLQVPTDIAVIGFDAGPHGALWRPALTSVYIDAEVYGRRAARLALGRDAGDAIPAPSHIVRRESA